MNNWPFNPVIFEIGPIKAHWYGLMYAIAFIFGYLYLMYSESGKKTGLDNKQKDSLAVYTILGVILGGRLGYILFYNLASYIENPIEIFSVWKGGMSLHGGVIGVTIALLIFSKIKKVQLFKISDFVTEVVPVGVMLVRIGNFINAELYGRIAENFCIYFPTDPNNCRYPSQLFQSLLEGLILFLILFIVSRKTNKVGLTSSLFLILYGTFRIIGEFFRQPDPQIGFIFGAITMGQILSSLMIAAGILIALYQNKNLWHNIKKNKNKNEKSVPHNKKNRSGTTK
jgi:phosphatidylglycerol---prolipoprotein diacylglyceryl transferase